MCPLAKGFSFSSYRSLHRVSPDMVVDFPKRVVRMRGGGEKRKKGEEVGEGRRKSRREAVIFDN